MIHHFGKNQTTFHTLSEKIKGVFTIISEKIKRLFIYIRKKSREFYSEKQDKYILIYLITQCLCPS